MDENIKALEHENTRLREALKKISEHQTAIREILDSVSDLLVTLEKTEVTPVTDDDVKQLLKKYSRLS